jgi:hypothetical protein
MMNSENDEHLDVCQNIEFGLKKQYENNGKLTDLKAMYALDQAKIAVRHLFGFAKNEQVVIDEDTKGVIEWCVSIARERIDKINSLTMKEYLNRMDKIKRSVQRHSEYGRRGYYEFIKDYV